MFEETIRRAVELQVDAAMKNAVARAKDELERRIPEIVAGLSIQVMERVSMETLGRELVIRVEMDKVK